MAAEARSHVSALARIRAATRSPSDAGAAGRAGVIILALDATRGLCYSSAPLRPGWPLRSSLLGGAEFSVRSTAKTSIGLSMSNPALTIALACLLIVSLATGCSTTKLPELPDLSDYTPEFLQRGNRDKSDLEQHYGISPARRLARINGVRRQVRSLAPHERARASDDLARQIQQEQDPVLRREIILSLASLGTPTGDAIIGAGLRGDKDTSVRIACCEALAVRGGPGAVRELLSIVEHDKEIDVRLAAMRAIGEIGDPNVVPALQGAIGPKEDPALQHRTAQVLSDLTGRDYGNDLVAWREFLATGTTRRPPQRPSLAEQALFWWR
ncbi:MAG: hypothetical protein DWQ31_11050 [Planctomycetota bacterium]|nr:MAG: hypothetical protein DWQ31_11050 [Planctomycetota bacterium]REJ94455.1 MAG: hypothetical protein DWQ35_08450 [Planctomycetota bacterium]REK22050.1 MAG: hypothetical protein DWQ42_18075 [Planctomycetota bacterium]REK44458.1 MAG: hypothetical protein DWQ46_09360 [Planctomycetota bacterium]